MGRVWKTVLAFLFVVAGCTGGSSSPQHATEVRVIRNPDIEVFMTVAATAGESQAVRKLIRRSRLVRSYAYLSHGDAYKEFRRLYADQPDLIKTTTADQLPTSFRITLTKGAKPKHLNDTLGHLTGVDEVKYSDPDDPLTKIIRHACRALDKHPLVDAEVFMKVGAAASDITGVRAALLHSRSVRTIQFNSVNDAYREFRRLFAAQPKLTASMTPEELPASFRVDLRKGATAKQLSRDVRRLPGVDTVQSAASIRSTCKYVGPTGQLNNWMHPAGVPKP
ncbi:MAG: permease-like cell division protein FtsX [Acidimicrobiia bacterium]